MQTLTQPTFLLKPFAENGDKNTLPIVNTDATQPQKADLTNGFPAITSLPPDQGGLPPERKDYNALGYLTTSYDWFYQCGGAFTFNQVVSDAIGGYPIGARLWYTDSSGTSMILRSTIENNTNNFLNDDTVIGEVGENKPWVIENFMGIKSQQPLLSFNWFDHALNDASWLRADTWSWQDFTIYKSAYQALVDAQSTGVQSSDLWTDYKVVGSPTITNGVMSGFSTTNYVYANTSQSFQKLANSASSWSEVFKINLSSIGTQCNITGGNSGTYAHDIIVLADGKLEVALSSDGSSYNIANNVVGTVTLSANTWYWIKLEFTGTQYILSYSTDGENYTTDITVTSSVKIESTSDISYIGARGNLGGPFVGSIDLTQTYYVFDGSKLWQGAVNVPYTRATNGWKIVSSANAGYVQDMYESTGVAWYYILDTANQRFKLPRTKYGFVGLRDAVGNYVPESLPDAKGQLAFEWQAGDGVFTQNTTANGEFGSGWRTNNSTQFALSSYNPVYQDNAPVQQRATQMYLYFYVGNTIRNQTEVDIGEITEALNKKWDSSNMQVVSELPENPQTGIFYFVK